MDNFKVGSNVGFKADYEEYGTVVKIKGSTLFVEVYDSNTGDTSVLEVEKYRAWLEE